jgi:hypothetical protein
MTTKTFFRRLMIAAAAFGLSAAFVAHATLASAAVFPS